MLANGHDEGRPRRQTLLESRQESWVHSLGKFNGELDEHVAPLEWILVDRHSLVENAFKIAVLHDDPWLALHVQVTSVKVFNQQFEPAQSLSDGNFLMQHQVVFAALEDVVRLLFEHTDDVALG